MSLNIVFMGTPEFATQPLRDLSQSEHSVTAVVTGPDAQSGRGRKLRPTPVKEVAMGLNLPVLTPVSLRAPEFVKELSGIAADVFVVVAFRILPRVVYSMPEFGSVNLHGSLLPRYRGAAPIQRALMNGETTTGLTVFSLADKVDTGRIILQKEMAILPEDTFTTLAQRMSAQSGPALIEALDLLESGNVEFKEQDNALATSAPKITPADCVIDWNASANSIVNQIRGLSETPGAFTFWRGKRLKALAARVCDSTVSLVAGEIALEGKRICVGAGDGAALELLTLQPEGKKKMSAVDLVNGQFLRNGERLAAGVEAV